MQDEEDEGEEIEKFLVSELDIYVYIYVYAYIHTCVHTYIHTYMHTCRTRKMRVKRSRNF
jgi:hypothetical protein